MKRVLILAFSNLHHDARVLRQIEFLKNNYQLTVASFDGPEMLGAELIKLKPIRPSLLDKIVSSFCLLARFYPQAYAILYDQPLLRALLQERSFDLIIGNDIESLPLAFELKKQAKILFDAHEYAPRHFEDKMIWRIFFQRFNKYLCNKYLAQTNAMTTVGKGLALEYRKYYKVDPLIITNANFYYPDINPGKVSHEIIRLIHHGGANPSRQLELMIDMMSYLDKRFQLDLMLITPPIANKKTRAYLDHLKALVANDARIKILPPKRPSEIVGFITQYDIGIFLIPPINFNYENTLPNKLFDFIQARLGIAIGPTPEMASIVNNYKLGVVSENFTSRSLADELNKLSIEQIQDFKNQSHKAAPELSAEQNKKILNDLVADLLKGKN
jgi:hypothetical protein